MGVEQFKHTSSSVPPLNSPLNWLNLFLAYSEDMNSETYL